MINHCQFKKKSKTYKIYTSLCILIRFNLDITGIYFLENYIVPDFFLSGFFKNKKIRLPVILLLYREKLNTI